MTQRSCSFSLPARDCRQAVAIHLLALSLLLALAGPARADSMLENWRQEAAAARRLAENDAPRAHQEALRLHAALPADAPPADRARSLNLLARVELYLALTEEASAHAESALKLALAGNDKVGQAEANLNMAIIAVNQGKIDNIGTATMSAMAALDGVDRPDLLGEAMLRTAMYYRRSGQDDASITLSMQTLDIAQRSGNPLFLCYGLQAMAIAMEQSGRLAESGDYYRRMAEQARVAGSMLLEGFALIGQAGVSSHLQRHGEAEAGGKEAIRIFRSIGAPFSLAHSLYRQADTLQAQNRLEEAIRYLDEVVDIYGRYPNKIGLWWALNTRSVRLLALGRQGLATADAEQAQALAKDIGAEIYLTATTRQLAALAAARGDFKRAYELSLAANATATQGERKRDNEQMEKLAERYQTEAKQRQIEELTRQARHNALEQRWLWTVLAASMLLLTVTGTFLARQRRSNRQLAALNAQVQQSSRKLQATLDAIPDLLFEMDLDGRIHDYHSPRTDLLAAPPEQILNRQLREFVPPDVAETSLAALREAESKGQSIGKQYALALPQGTAWFELSVARKPDVPDRQPRFIVLVRDITGRKQAEQGLRLLQQAMDQSSDAMFVKDLQTGCFVIVNDAACRSLGYDREELLGMTVLDIDPDMTPEILEHAHKTVEFGKAHLLETRHRSKDGRTFPVEVTGAFFEDNGVPYAISLVRNITARKRIENALRFIANPDGERDFLAGLARHLGEALGTTHVLIDRLADDPAIAETVALYARGDILPNLHYPLADTPCADVAGKNACCYPRGVQALFPKDTLLADMGVESYAGVPLWDSTGRPIGLIAVLDEAPLGDEGAVLQLLQIVAPRAAAELERARSDARLLASEQAFRALVENSLDSVVRYDRECRRVYVNPAALSYFGQPLEKVLGRTPQQFSPYLDADHFVGLLRQVLETGKVIADEQPFRSPDGSTRWGHTRLVPEYGPDGAIASVLSTVRDITDLKMAENRLRESYSLLQELASRRETAREEERKRIAREIHDELGQQLTALRLKVNLLNFQFGSATPGLREATVSVLAMVDQTIQVARDVSTSLRPAALDMGIVPALDWLAANFERNTGVPCELETLSDGLRLDEDRAIALFRIAQESLTNATRYAEAYHVRITLEEENGCHILEIADDGKGFDPDLARAHKFGLVGIRERALAVGGTTDIDTAPGRGTRVRVTIPISQ